MAQKRSVVDTDIKRLNWRSVGPGTMGGRVSEVVFAPGESKVFYVGLASGGLFRTKNHGTTLESLFDKEETTSVGSIAVCDLPSNFDHPAEAKAGKSKKELKELGRNQMIWLGTGEGNGRNSSSWGNGVYRSTDAGATWQHMGLADSHDIPAIVVDPRNPDVCYVAALGHLWGANEERGLYKTTDGGKTWTKVLAVKDHGCCDVRLDPRNPDVIFAAMYYRRRKAHKFDSGSTEGGLFRSQDGGKSWKKIKGGLPTHTGRIGIDLFAENPDIMYAVIESGQGGTNSIRDDRSKSGGLFRSEDGGNTWTRMSVRAPRAFYFCKVRIHPKNDQKIYMLGWEVEVSEDGGRTFRGGFGDKMHVDMHSIAFDPNDPDHIVVGNDGGIYQTFDGGAKWQFLNQIAIGQFYNIALDMSEPYRIAGGLQDNGSWVGPSSTLVETEKYEDGTPQTGITNSDWKYVCWGDGFHVAFDPEDPDVIYAEWQGGNLTKANLKTGRRWHLQPQQREGGAAYRFNWNAPFFVSPHNPSVLYLGGNMVFRLSDRGETWERISGDLTTNDVDKITTEGSAAETFCTVTSLVESPLTEGLLWAGTDDGRVHVRVEDEWKDVTPKGNDWYVSRIDASAHGAGRATMSLDGHRDDQYDPRILQTTDFGKTWNDITGDLPKHRSVKVVREDPKNPNVIYCGTENGVYVTLNGGKAWLRLNGKNLPHCPVDDIQIHPREHDVVLGTHGRSIWILDDARFLSESTEAVLGEALHVFTPRNCRPIERLFLQGLWADDEFRGTNPPKFAPITYWLKEAATEEVSVTVTDEKGREIASMSGTGFAGYNRVVWDAQPKEIYRLPDAGQEPWWTYFVAPGTYKIQVKCGKLKSETSLEVLPVLNC